MEILLGKAEAHSVGTGDPVSLRKRLFNVLVEGLENLNRHVAESDRTSCSALLMDDGRSYRLVLGNAVPLAAAALLMHRVSVLNEMDDVDLKEHFMKLLASDGRTERGGAGLGLITMARKSARPMVSHSVVRDERS
ncbi:MAG TPA: DUF6272 family protein, partial [Flavobacteriales bacterium]|nr:DUF6272 family protein [Flavobacteriales bacterium]